MTPERIAALVAWWVRFYTLGLPGPIAERRMIEIRGDLSDQIEHERAAGESEGRIAFHLLSRVVRGAAADASWRNQHLRTRPRKSLVRPPLGVLCTTALLLSIPLIAMQFTNEVVWTPIDFAVAGMLLGGTGTMIVLLLRAGYGPSYKLAAATALGTCLMLIWASLAVGIIGVEGDPADRMYAGVLGVGIIGAALTRLRPRGMSRTLLAMALTQMLVAGIAILVGKHHAPYSSALEILGVNAFFAALFLGSALLFGFAGRRSQRT